MSIIGLLFGFLMLLGGRGLLSCMLGATAVAGAFQAPGQFREILFFACMALGLVVQAVISASVNHRHLLRN